jgi:hypothetical protein
MNQPKNYTKMILDRLNKKIEQSTIIKQDPMSTLKTQCTLNDSSNSKTREIRAFFDSFEYNAVTIHEPVMPARKPLRRCLFYEL